ncbi:microsomal signal peptidase subunit [Histoplasma capsulatum var. duboisii H88]|uniref:Signal peptidase subunit 3 n=1 Tax=Ajellomyces capsulatus (strain H88) TaxID=544711 RepID=F0UPX5_AJEC8|nr:microsomal signal peptidase subunit [Histoplasma capsulatum var. duboisii H88]QSS53196.1 microsomal signal peptidase subunit [Histoplasma capsulatum var. duboisii H88]
MHSALNRFQGVFGFCSTLAFLLGALTSLTVLLSPADPVTNVSLSNIQVSKGRPHYYARKREEYAQIKFDLDADLTSLFNWNTKQVFVYVLASYPTTSSSSSNLTTESIIWDMIIPATESPLSIPALTRRFFPSKKSKSSRFSSKTNKNTSSDSKKPKNPGLLRLRNQKSKYQITDISGQIALRENAQLVVAWNVQPWIGALMWSPHSKVAENIGGALGGLLDAVIITGGKGGRSKPFNFPALKVAGKKEG